MSTKLKIIALALLSAVAVVGCQPPSEPSSLKDESQTSTQNSTPKEPELEFDAGGAPVGEDANNEKFKTCLASKKFFDRKNHVCTDYALAKVGCTDDKIKLAMPDSTYISYLEMFKAGKDLEGYKLDQCLDCSEPSKNPLCKGSDASPQTEPGIRLYFVKAVGTKTEIQNRYLRKKPKS